MNNSGVTTPGFCELFNRTFQGGKTRVTNDSSLRDVHILLREEKVDVTVEKEEELKAGGGLAKVQAQQKKEKKLGGKTQKYNILRKDAKEINVHNGYSITIASHTKDSEGRRGFMVHEKSIQVPRNKDFVITNEHFENELSFRTKLE